MEIQPLLAAKVGLLGDQETLPEHRSRSHRGITALLVFYHGPCYGHALGKKAVSI